LRSLRHNCRSSFACVHYAAGSCPKRRCIMLSFECPLCRAKYEVGDQHAGRKTKCRQCGAPLQVPDLLPAPEFIAATGTAAQMAPPMMEPIPDIAPVPSRAGRTYGICKWVALVIGGLFALEALSDTSAIRVAAYAGMGCFFGILSRILQAEEHRRRG
jgi:hypothetical protein